jgi:Right handed beta helix region
MSTKSVGKVKIGVSHFRLSALLAAVLAISAMGPPSANGLACGTPLYLNTTLMANVGPCSGTGPALIIAANPGIVLNLNGHRIIGTNPPTTGSIGVQVLWPGSTVQGGPAISPGNGPGTITGFDTGIDMVYDLNTVTHVHLIRNNTGIRSEIGGNNIVANTLKGNSCRGIYSDNSNGSDSITNNLIAGSNAPTTSIPCPGGGAGIESFGDGYFGVVQGNAVYNNTTGMNGYPNPTGISVSGNDFSNNIQSGAYINTAFDGLTVVSGNWFNDNGQDGLSLNNVYNGEAIQNNFAYGNKRYGIALVGSDSTGYSPDLLTGNVTLGNGTDDLYSFGSPGNTWTNNTCDTRSGVPPQLPPPC